MWYKIGEFYTTIISHRFAGVNARLRAYLRMGMMKLYRKLRDSDTSSAPAGHLPLKGKAKKRIFAIFGFPLRGRQPGEASEVCIIVFREQQKTRSRIGSAPLFGVYSASTRTP